jgi:two-component sensor histidine kinase
VPVRTRNISFEIDRMDKEYRSYARSLLPQLIVMMTALYFIDIYESYLFEYTGSLICELSRFVIIWITLAAKKIFRKGTTWFYNHSLFWLVLFFYGTLWIPDENYYLTLPWLIVITVLPFWLMPFKDAIRWAQIQMVILGIVTLLTGLDIIHPLYNASLLLQVWGALGIVVYLMCTIDTKRHIYEENIRTLARENKLLYEEMLHRTKNNLQLVIGLIEQEKVRHDDPDIRSLLDKITNRVYTFNFIQTSRTRGHHGAVVDFTQTLRRLVSLYETDGSCTLAVKTDALFLNQKIANHLALIVNESLSNVQKHACPNGADRVEVGIERSGKSVRVYIHDNAPNPPKEACKDSSGLQLCSMLAQSLFHGTFTAEYRDGMRVDITFELDEEAV